MHGDPWILTDRAIADKKREREYWAQIRAEEEREKERKRENEEDKDEDT